MVDAAGARVPLLQVPWMPNPLLPPNRIRGRRDAEGLTLQAPAERIGLATSSSATSNWASAS